MEASGVGVRWGLDWKADLFRHKDEEGIKVKLEAGEQRKTKPKEMRDREQAQCRERVG